MIVFESDEVQAIYEPGDSDFLLITFGAIAMRPNGRGFFGQPVTQSAGIAALGFMAKRPNWYPAMDMRLARDVLDDILLPHKERVTFGYSMGAYGAIKFSGLFGARTCVAISPQFSIDPNDVAAFDRSYIHFFSDKLHTGMAVRKEECPEDVFIVYDNKYLVDVRHMALYKKVIDPFLINVPYTGHMTMRCLTGTQVVTTVFDLCRNRDLTALNALVRERRKPHPIRASRLCLALAFKHPAWAHQILQNRADDMLETEVHEAAVRIGQGAVRRNMLEVAEKAFLRALPIASPGENRALAGLATVHFRRGDMQKAVETAREAIAVNQTDIGTRAWLCSVLVKIGDFQEARLEAEAGLVLAPDHVSILSSMAVMAENQGQLDEALAWARRAAETAPASDRLYFGERVIHLLIRCGDWDLARSETIKLLGEHPSNVDFLLRLADVSDRNGRTDEALAWMHRAAVADTGNVRILERIAHLHTRTGDLHAAEKVLIAAVEIDPNALPLLRNLSDLCVRQGRPEAAMDWLLTASITAPDDISVKEAIANLAIRSGDLRMAHNIATQALSRDPANVRLMQCLADVHGRRSEYAEASEWTKKAIAVDGSNLHLRERLVYLSIRAGDFEAARDFAIEVIDLDPKNANMMRCLADAHERLSEMTDAVTWARKAVAVDASNLHLRERLAQMLTATNDLPAAEQVLLGSLGIDPAHFGSLRHMAEIMLRHRRYDQAIAYAERAVSADPGVAWFRDWFAGIYLLTGDLKAADVQVHAGLALAPDNPHLLRRAEQVQTLSALPPPWIAAAPTGEYGLHWKRRHTELVEGVKIAKPRVLFMGDSITNEWAMTGRTEWDRHFASLAAWQSAISGETTQGLLWRIENGAIDQVSPDCIVLLIGTNNISRSRDTDIVTGIEHVWTEIMTRQPAARLVALALLPRDLSSDSWYRHQVNRINDGLKLRAEQRRIEFVDLADCLLEPDGTLSPEIAPDGIHLSAAGYQRIAPRIRERLA